MLYSNITKEKAMTDYRILMTRAIYILWRLEPKESLAYDLARALSNLVEDPTNDTKADRLHAFIQETQWR